MALKEYELVGTCPILVNGYGRVEPEVGSDGEPTGKPVVFRCEMEEKQEDWFVNRHGSVRIKSAELPADAQPTEPKKPSTPAWLQMEKTLDKY